MANLKIDVRIFSGKTLEEAAEKANNHPPLQIHGSFKASHVLRDGDEFKIVIILLNFTRLDS